MYFCPGCKQFFVVPEHKEILETYESHGFHTVDVGYNVCPYCGLESYFEAEPCVHCGENPVDNDGDFCDYCLEAILDNEEAFKYLLKQEEVQPLQLPLIYLEFFTESEITKILGNAFDEYRKLYSVKFKDRLVKLFKDTDLAASHGTQLIRILKGDSVDD